MKISFLSIILMLCLQLSNFAQQKYWIEFTDKGDISALTPEDFLSEAAINNRKRQGIKITYSDYPVNQEYLNAIRALNIKSINVSKWFNRMSAKLSAEQIGKLHQLPFVKAIHPVGVYRSALAEAIAMDCESIEDKDTPEQQLSMIGLDQLHQKGFTGKGITIAVFDNGYDNANTISGLSRIFQESRLTASWDYVDNDNDVFNPCSHCLHGTWVFSIIGGKLEGEFTGTAPDANYILLRTENDDSETHQEEDNWVAAAEFADSLGAQVFNTSLGYFEFDPGEGDYTLNDLDGNTAIITRAADMAASKGIIVVNSAGNNGADFLATPADGDSVIAVGSVNSCEEYSTFSSQGFSADGRVKPDLTALGEGTYFINTSGFVRRGNGTSFSSPVIAGMMACLLQAVPEATERQLYNATIQSAHQYDQPDKFLGYGIPNAWEAYQLLTQVNNKPPISSLNGLVYPNPNRGVFQIRLQHEGSMQEGQLAMINMMGEMVYEQHLTINNGTNQLEINKPLPTGVYILRLSVGNQLPFTSSVIIKQ